jgi:fatty acid desaturase
MVFNPQSFTLQHAGAYNTGLKMTNQFTLKRRKFAVALRLLYIYLNIFRPLVIGGWDKVGITCIQILIMGGVGSLTLGTLFSLSHNFEMTERDPTKSYRETGKPVCWYKAQVETSSTYGGFIAGALTGGLNFQIEHHLFPRMCSAYYPVIAPTVREVCKKHGVRYVYYPWVFQNLVSTLSYMHKTGAGDNWKTPLSGNL